MMDKTIIYVIIMAGSVFISSVSQVILKKAATRTYESKVREYLNIKVIFAYVLFFGSSLITVFALKYVPFSLEPIIESMGYIFVGVMSYLFLRERLNRRQLAGMVLIIIGVAVYSLSTI